MAEVTREEYQELVDLLLRTQAEVSGIRTALHSIISSYPDKQELAFRLSDQLLRMEAVMGSSIAPDVAIESTASLLRELIQIAQR
jgi:hypothetical protein